MESVFHALAHPARRQALRYLARESLTAGDLAARFDAAAPTMSRHFSILKEADLIREERRGTSRVYSLNASLAEEVLASVMTLLAIEKDAPE
ncbi:hypothetical protein B5C34_05620 [Pacificimonas flava]|uniref:HTH arsR-type domain-containing protein n=2 Tax=Pacificimonas TaxID=1960290 RepID=A0A219B3Q7_9SPHN|nr:MULTISPECIES: metalloregulator ArsR/SmtB family transcription factor [Pacificimonas]MBZ6377300.1 winged helix-turn-helix transcriptional regulator [Pacificimonas aurantium]OWV32990.1 hypothetical protein B5C34_05620 [Pacificimonas flava]